MVDAHNHPWFSFVMAGLKSFLFGVAPILGTTGAALYERQRALVSLGVIESAAGRGPGSGAPLTGENFAAVLISVLATDNLSEVDQRVVDLCNAAPTASFQSSHHREWKAKGSPTFKTEIGRLLSGEPLAWGGPIPKPAAIRVSRIWRGQIIPAREVQLTYVHLKKYLEDQSEPTPISLTAAIERETLGKLIAFTSGALTAAIEEEDDE
jgi:hypothetical protein